MRQPCCIGVAALQVKKLRDLRLMMVSNIQTATQARMKEENGNSFPWNSGSSCWKTRA
jgi:hypothetical protein